MPIPPPPTFSQANTTPPKLSRDEAKGRGALLTDICQGSKLKKVAVVNDRSAPLLDKPKGGGAATAGANESAAGSPSSCVPPIGALFPGSVPKLRLVGDGSSGRSPSTRAAAPRPPSHLHDDTESPSPQTLSPPPTPSSSSPSPPTNMKHSSSAPPPPPLCRRGNAPSPPSSSCSVREKLLPLPPNNTPPLPSKPPPSPGNSRRPPTSGGNPASSLAPPPPLYRITNDPAGGEAAPELPQRHNSLSSKRPAPSPGGHAPSPGGHAPTRGPAPPPPPASPSLQGANRPPPPSRETPGRGAAPSVPVQPSSLRPAGREAPPPPYRPHGSPSLSADPPARGRPPPPPTRTPAAPPPPPPPLRNGPSSSGPRSFVDDFESRYSFHLLEDFPPPDEFRHVAQIYPSKASRVIRGAPPLPPVGR
ncbi:WAS/WASL-interacting protein family member 2-like isoform X2 [Clinocottus analis]|uniref:WAS/WASL-interacting protein family member 2-like isoform X2 n=1 Tax=Clinocottus analis TaxID=304258 RepID=UPI0035C1763D